MAPETLDSPVNDRIDAAASASDQSPPSDPTTSSDRSLGRNVSFSRLNAQAPEFVPRSSNRGDLHPPPQVAIPPPPPPVAVVHVYPMANSPFHLPPPQSHGSYQYVCGFGERDAVHVPADPDPPPQRNGVSEEVAQKIVNQVEYYFSDINLATTDLLMRSINKDPEGFVPISVVASFKKIKTMVSNHTLLASVLRTSTKLVVSEDGKKIRRRHPFTDTDMEELQSRTIVAENLPEDHSYQNLMKVFSIIGSVKTIRTCPPQTSTGAASAASRSGKTDMLFSNKLHAFVEYESVELAEKAVSSLVDLVVELNDERNWRTGLRVRLMHKRMTKPVRGRRAAGHESESNCEEDDVSTSEQANEKQLEDPQSPETSPELNGDDTLNEKEGGTRKGRGRGRGKGRGRGQYHNNRGGHPVGTPPSSNPIQNDQNAVNKQPPGPRMPDGTRGFTVGRGRPMSTTTA